MSDAEVPLPRHRANGTATGIESMPSAGLVSETQVMRQEEPGSGDPIGPLDWREILPFEVAAASHRLGWVGLEAARCRAEPAFEVDAPALTHHRLVLIARPPEELDLLNEGVKRHVPPPAGSIMLVPAGSPTRVRSRGHKDELHIFLEAGLVARVAAEAFGFDPVRTTVPPLDGLDLPHLRAAMGAVDAELTAGGAGGRLAAESLVNILAVHLIRHVLAPRRPERGRDGALPRGRLRAVVEYIEEHLDAGPTLEQMAAVASLSPKFQRARMGISVVDNDLRRTPFPVSGYILINRSASACSASASVTRRNGVWLRSADTIHVLRQRVPR